MHDLSTALNGEQLAAVQAPDGPVLVLAAAGTGKTRTLVYRVAHLVDNGVPSGSILLLTFTNRAAKEMCERAVDLVGESVGGLWGGTFHHMANRMLRRHATALGYTPDYTIIDRDDSRTLIKGIIDELRLTDKAFPKPDVLISLYGLAASTNGSVMELAENQFAQRPISTNDVCAVHTAYAEKKRALNVMDFDDLLTNGLELFRKHPGILEQYGRQFRHILVDEYQDTNPVQAEWVDRLAVTHGNLFVVGDDFQSIYSWRGADFRNILTFPERYPGASVYKLETNYRSAPEILHVANACIAGNPDQFQKQLRAVRELAGKPRLVHLGDGYSQARYIVEGVTRLRAEGYSMSDMAVLYRSHFHAMELQLELTRARIPYSITSGTQFFEQAHVKDACSLPRLLANPGDELAFIRLVEMFPRVGRKTALRIWAKLKGCFPVTDVAMQSELRRALPGPAQSHWDRIRPVVIEYTQDELASKPGEVIGRFVGAYYDEYAVETFDNAPRRLEDLEELAAFSSRFTTLEAFLAEVALMTNVDAENQAAGDDQDALRLSTVHQAKGLEWSVVFIVWLAEGMFPSGRSLNEDGGEGEERRLFYVASTRAKDELHLCVPKSRRDASGSMTYYRPSRFTEEVPSELMRTVYGS